MLAVLTVILYALVVVVALLLIGLILIQPSKSGGLGATFGGIGESVFGAQAGSHLTKATVVLTAVFFLFTLLLATLIGHGANRSEAISGVDAALQQTAKQNAAPAAAAMGKVTEAASTVVPAAESAASTAEKTAPAAAESGKK